MLFNFTVLYKNLQLLWIIINFKKFQAEKEHWDFIFINEVFSLFKSLACYLYFEAFNY